MFLNAIKYYSKRDFNDKTNKKSDALGITLKKNRSVKLKKYYFLPSILQFV